MATPNHVYITNSEYWVCSCLAFARSPFQICKHLVRNMEAPTYRDVERFRKPPFLLFRLEEGRHCANIDNELRLSSTEVAGVQDEQDPVGGAEEPPAVPDEARTASEHEEEAVNIDVVACRAQCQDMKAILNQFMDHIEELQGNAENLRQAQFLKRHIVNQIERYMSDLSSD